MLKLAVEAARVRATLGEISQALESVWGRHVASSQVVQGAYNASFNAAAHSVGAKSTGKDVEAEYNDVLTKVKAFAEKEGRRPRILVAKMGQDGHDRGAKVLLLTSDRIIITFTYNTYNFSWPTGDCQRFQ